MLVRFNPNVQSLLFGCLVCLLVTSGVNADGRVFVLFLRNSSGQQGFRDAEQACASHHARLASAEELRHAVMECFFSSCTRGWLYGGSVGTTVCNIVGGTLKAVDVRTENATVDTAHLDAFCVKDRGDPCGDPPSFPNARLQEHSGFEMGDELLYTCVPGYVMPSGHTAFSLLCDSCGEWYGLVQICVKGETESHVDYEDKFTDTYGVTERQNKGPQEAQGEVHEEVYGAAYPERRRSQEQQETSFTVTLEHEHQDQHGKHEGGGKYEGDAEDGEQNEERAVEDFIGHPSWEQERSEVVRTDAAPATEAPVSLLSQKHMFWFPSEAFQEEGPPVSTNPVTQTTQRASGAQSEESKEHESQEKSFQHPVTVDHRDPEQDSDDDHGDSRHDDHEDGRYDDPDDGDSHQDEELDDHVKHPDQHDDLDRRDRYEDNDDHNDHYDMGEHEEDRHHVRHGSQGFDDHDDTYDEHESYEDHDDPTDDNGDGKHPHGSEEHPDHDDHDDGGEHYDLDEDDSNHDTDHDDHHDHDHHDDRDDRDDHERRDDHSYDDHDSHEDDDGHRRVIISTATNEQQNVTQRKAGGKASTDETWLDGYPVVSEENDDTTTEQVSQEDRERGTFVKTTDRPNEVDVRRPVPYTSLPEEHDSPTTVTELDQAGVEEDMWPGIKQTSAPSPDSIQPSNTPSYSDTLDYDTQQAAPTHSWQGDLTEHPFLDHGPVPPVHDGDKFTGVLDLPGETGERGKVEGDMGEAICVGEDCPPRPPSSSSRGPTVAAIIVAVCAVVTAIIVGVWCYRRQQQKSSVYEMNGKGQSQTRQGQQIEMQQKV